MVSVVVVTRNRQSLLGDCLFSLTQQTKKPDEILVIDNASSDNTKSVVEEISRKHPHIKYVYCPKLGIPFSRNMGISKAKHEIVAFLDDDCNPDINWFENVEKHSKLASKFVLQGGAKNPNPTNILSTALFYLNQRSLYLELYTSIKRHTKFKVVNFFDTKNFVIHKNHIKKIGHFFEEQHILAADLFFQSDLVHNNINILYIPGIEVNHSYMTTISGYIKKIIWAKQCKKIFGNTQISHTRATAHVQNVFGQNKLKQAERVFKKRLKRVNRVFFNDCSAKMSLSKKLLLKTTVFITQFYLGDTL